MRHALAILLVLAVAPAPGCATKIRNITATAWTHQGVYVGYWEGTCKAIFGCDAGDGKVTFCELADDNTLVCQDQDEIGALLARDKR